MRAGVGSTRSLYVRGEQAIELANDEMSVVVVPVRGAKVVSLHDRIRDVEWLAPPLRDWTTPSPGDWLGQDCGGWDECFPNVVGEPHPLTGQPLSGHGEVWSRSWHIEKGGPEQVVTSIVGSGFPFRLTRALTLRDHRLTCAYRLENLSTQPLVANWLMHLLLGIVESMRLILPGGGAARQDPDTGPFTRARVTTSGRPRGLQTDLDRLPDIHGPYEPNVVFQHMPTGTGTKWITVPHIASSCLVLRPTAALLVEVDPEQVPQFGLWVNDGGWPEDDPQRHLGIEAALGGFDRLSRAHEEATAIQLEGHQAKEWSVDLLTLSAAAGRKLGGDRGSS